MLKDVNIKQFLKAMLLVISVVFMLTACGQSGDDSGESRRRSALPGDLSEKTDTISKEHRTCWQTGLVTMLYDNMGTVAMGMYSKITTGALPFMMLAFAVWTSLRLVKFMGSFSEESPGEMWNEIIRKLFVCFACGWLASSTDGMLWILDTVVFPIYYSFLELGSRIMADASTAAKVDIKTGTFIKFFAEEIDVTQPVICKAVALSKASLSAFPTAPKEMMECMICAVNARMSLGFALSFEVMAAPGFMATIIGFIILCCFTFVKLGFAFYLVDSIFRFTIMAVILPILVMSYAFKATSSWAKNGLLTILNSAALMMFLAVMMAMALLAMEKIIMDNHAIFDEGAGPESFAEFSIPFMCLMMIGFLIVSSVNLAQQVTGALVGGNSESNFQKRVGKLVASIFWNTLLLVSGGASKGIEKTVKRMTKSGKE